MFDMHTIRPDICIALRMIALQEQWRQGQEFLSNLEEFVKTQEPLGEEFEKILYDNLNKLYVED